MLPPRPERRGRSSVAHFVSGEAVDEYAGAIGGGDHVSAAYGERALRFDSEAGETRGGDALNRAHANRGQIDAAFLDRFRAFRQNAAPRLKAMRARGAEHQIEKVGAELRAMMPFIQKQA